MTQQTRSNFISTVSSTLTDGGKNTAAEVRTILGNAIDSAFVTLTDSSDVITQGSTNLFLTSAERTKLTNTSGTNTGDQTTVSGNAGSATVLQTARNIGGVSFNGSANIVPQTIQTVDDTADSTCFILFGNASGSQTSGQQPKTNTSLTFNATTGALGATSVTATTFTGALTGNASTATSAATLTTARNIGGVSFNGSADIVPQLVQTVDDTADATCFVTFVNASGTQTGGQQQKTNTALTFNATTGALGATSFTGAVTGGVTGNASTATALQTARTIGGVSFDGTANIVPQTIQTVDDTSDTTCFVLFGNASGTQSQQPKTNSTLAYNASTGILAATGFSGPLTGNVTGNCSGSSGSTTGNAATATALQTARTINGTSFNGTANITVTAAAGTLTGTTLNATVVTSSLTSVGTIGTGTWQGTAVGATFGGTAQTSWATGDMLYASGSNTLAKRTIGSTDDVLMVSGGVPTWTGITTVRQIPQNSQSAAYTLVLSDGGKHILHPSADTTARIFTIPANSSVAFPIGTAVTFINQNAAGVITIAITTDTMRLAGAGTTGSRTLAANGVATAIKITSTEWIISGTGLT